MLQYQKEEIGSKYVGEPTDLLQTKSLTERARMHVDDTLLRSHYAYGDIRKLWQDYFERYSNTALKLSTTDGSQLPTGHASELVDSYVAEFFGRMFAAPPLCPLRPRNFPEDVDATRAIESLLEYDYQHMNIETTDYEMLQSLCIYGTAVQKVFWRQEVSFVPQYDKKGTLTIEKVLAYRGPWVSNVFLQDCYPHPEKRFAEDGYPVATVYWKSYDQLLEGVERGYYDKKAVASVDAKLPAVYAPILGSRGFHAEQRKALGYTNDSSANPDGILVVEWEGKFRFSENGEPIQSILTLANGVVVRAEPTPFVTGESAYVWTIMSRIPGQLYGTGVIGKSLPQLHGANVALNLALTHLAKTVKGTTIIRDDLLRDPGNLQNPPGGIHRAKRGADPRMIVHTVDRQPLGNDVFNVLSYLHERAARINAVSNLRIGEGPSGDNTAFEISEIQREIDKRFSMPMRMIEKHCIIPRTRKMHRLNQQFLDPEFISIVLDRDSRYFPVRLDPQHLSIDPDYIPQASQRAGTRAMAVSQLTNQLRMVTPLMQIDPRYKPVVDALILRILEEDNFQNLPELRSLISGPPAVPEASGGEEVGQGGQGAPGIGNVRRDNRLGDTSSLQSLVQSAAGVMAGENRIR